MAAEDYVDPITYEFIQRQLEIENAATKAQLAAIERAELERQAQPLRDAVQMLFRVAQPDVGIEYCVGESLLTYLQRLPQSPDFYGFRVRSIQAGIYLPKMMEVVPVSPKTSGYTSRSFDGVIGVDGEIIINVQRNRRNAVPVKTRKTESQIDSGLRSMCNDPFVEYFSADEYFKLLKTTPDTIFRFSDNFLSTFKRRLYDEQTIPTNLYDPVLAAVNSRIQQATS